MMQRAEEALRASQNQPQREQPAGLSVPEPQAPQYEEDQKRDPHLEQLGGIDRQHLFIRDLGGNVDAEAAPQVSGRRRRRPVGELDADPAVGRAPVVVSHQEAADATDRLADRKALLSSLDRFRRDVDATGMMKGMFSKKGVATIKELIDVAIESEVKLIACQMTMDVFGYEESDFLDGVEFGGAAAFLSDARKSHVTLFI